MTGPVSPVAATLLRPLTGARITGGLLGERQQVNGDVAVRSGRERLEAAGNLDNLRIAAGTSTGDVRGPIFMDSDVYKWLEAVAWEYARRPGKDLLDAQREVTALVAAAQQSDGYLNSVVQVRDNGVRYRDLPWSHEHYCAGHLIQAAVAQVRCTGDRELLDVAIRFADHLAETFGPDARHDVDGHPIIEQALVELYRETAERRYLELARYFVDARGHGLIAGYGLEPTYFSDRVPVREQTTVEGHAVRAVYLATGAADVAIETGDEALLGAVAGQFARMLATRTYVTGGLGSRWEGESFGDDHELPPDRAYAETCAAVGGIQWAWRMLLATGEPGYADAIERILYNGFLSGVSLTGTEYFYVNPLQLREGAHADENRSPAHGRRAWFDCACCPPNAMRTLAGLDAYLATTDAEGLQIHLYAPSTLTAGDAVLTVRTDYPWDGRVEIHVDQAPVGSISLRVPAWAAGATLDGKPVEPGTYATVRRTWQAGDVLELVLPMPVRLTAAPSRVDAVRGCRVIERGPLVYAVEQADGPTPVDDLRLDPDAPLTADFRAGLLGGVTVVSAPGFTAVPYFAWANRGIGPMRVWLPLSTEGTD